MSLDGLFSRYQQERRDNYILALSFGRPLSANGQPMVSIRDVEFDIVRFLTLRKIEQARAAQNAEYEAQFAKKR